MFKRILLIAIPALLILQLAVLTYSLWAVFKVDPLAWNIFLNAKLPLIATQVAVPLLVLLCIDWGSIGYTIRTLVNINEQSPAGHLVAAAIFMVGIFWGLVWACKGGF